ncbi:MAG: hypothetical protein ABSE73_25305 [Planctomycetota bacterium]
MRNVFVAAMCSVILAFIAVGCTAPAQAELAADVAVIKTDLQEGSAIAAQVMPAVSQIVNAAAPGTSVSKAVAKATVQVQHVNGAVQKVTINLPGTGAPQPTAAPLPAAQVVPVPGQ